MVFFFYSSFSVYAQVDKADGYFQTWLKHTNIIDSWFSFFLFKHSRVLLLSKAIWLNAHESDLVQLMSLDLYPRAYCVSARGFVGVKDDMSQTLTPKTKTHYALTVAIFSPSPPVRSSLLAHNWSWMHWTPAWEGEVSLHTRGPQLS